MEIVVFAEYKSGTLTSPAKSAFGAASKIASENGHTVSGVIIGKNVESIASQCFALGASKVYKVEDDQLEVYRTLTYSKVFLKLVEDYKPGVIILGYSTTTTDLAPRFATKLNLATITGATGLNWEGDNLIITKPVYNEKLNVKYELSGDVKIVVLGIGAFTAPQPTEGATGEVVNVKVDFEQSDLIEEIVSVEMVAKTVDLSEAKLIVSGGRGVGSGDKFSVIFDTAKALGGQAASSRAVWDAGWTSDDIHVGQTGGSVSPDIYIAAGISGAIQHVAGIKKSKNIIVVNTDPEAPIWDVAKYGIVGDLHKVLPLIADKSK